MFPQVIKIHKLGPHKSVKDLILEKSVAFLCNRLNNPPKHPNITRVLARKKRITENTRHLFINKYTVHIHTNYLFHKIPELS